MMLGVGGKCCVWVSAFFSFLFYSFAFLMITHDTLASNFIFTFRLCNDCLLNYSIDQCSHDLVPEPRSIEHK